MMDQQLAQQLMATYLDELHEHVSVLGREILAQEKPLAARELEQSWETVSRSIHTLKGASAIVNVEPIRDVCHYLEDVFGFHQRLQTAMPEDLTSFVLQVVDSIEEYAARLRANDELESTPLIALIPKLKQASHQFTNESPTENASTSQYSASNPVEVGLPASATINTPTDCEPEFVEPDITNIDPRLLALFVDELDEHAQTLSRNILALENTAETDASGELLNEIFRAAHSLKGAAGAVQIDVLRDVCHHLEDLLSELRDRKISLTSAIVSRVLEAADAIGDVGQRLRSGKTLQGCAIFRMSEKLDGLTSDQPVVASAEMSTDAPPANTRSGETQDIHSGKSQPNGPSPPSRSTPTSNAKVTNRETTNKETASAQSKPKQDVAVQRAIVGAPESTASIRVAAQKLDALLAHSGELLVARGRFAQRAKEANDLRDLASDLRSHWKKAIGAEDKSASAVDGPPQALKQLAKKLDSLSTGMDADNRLLSQTCSLLDDEIYHVRMLPFDDACVGLSRAVRDIATTTQKQVSLRVEGSDVEVDRSVLEGLKDPLLHLVRNAVDHGIEQPSDRIAAGKSAEAIVTVSASLRGGQVEVVVEDDGSGFDLKRICAMAAKRGLEVPDDPREQARLVFAPGFSTAKMITDISGRGVGLDVVQNRVESLHGAVEISFVKGQGTRFTLMVPLTLTTIRSMLVVVSDQVYAIPTTSIQRLVRFSASDVVSSVGRDTLLLREAPTPLVPLATPLGLKSRGLLAGATAKGVALVLTAGDQRVALSVDDVLSEQEVLVKNLGSRIRRLRHFSGCTLLPNGRIALVTNSANVVRAALGATATFSDVAGQPSEKWVRKQLLLVDDSVTTLALLKNILETAGYDVVAAGDGQQAWELARETDYDVVVSDVDMPIMNGFELTTKLRGEPRTAETPIVLVTARGSDGDKQQGVLAGANAYIVKGSFDQQNLLDTLAQLA